MYMSHLSAPQPGVTAPPPYYGGPISPMVASPGYYAPLRNTKNCTTCLRKLGVHTPTSMKCHDCGTHICYKHKKEAVRVWQEGNWRYVVRIYMLSTAWRKQRVGRMHVV